MEPYGNLLSAAPLSNGMPSTVRIVAMVGVIMLRKEWVVTNVTQANAVNNVCAILAGIGAQAVFGVFDWVIRKLVDLFATGDDYVAFGVFGEFHVRKNQSRKSGRSSEARLCGKLIGI